ncbi:MAG: Uma2 family endonuclease [Tychonema bourrellyi B0820]|uniref:Uma2 family endonuclease n=1 Tax=Tychonema bourrellyi FEM_GT703 TaxID=2040638 RepID=A0A2G4EYN7_9CYAN|nr:Uma2 family endonuclease [Tychonema bourrellyi]MDQ2097445.1 Uma2 family endonuclease [Tychonema bourrellyi B0820]PHX54606.1 Uma2 family endonuclease [Tychonema bourrellyi FEM_GT703]
MTATLEKLDRLDEPILIDGLSWRDFKLVEQLLSRPGVRLSFLDGVLEIRRITGEKHETIKERIGSILDLYLLQMGIDYQPTGSMTLESPSGLVKREADKSYKLGANRERPDLVVEVVVTSGGIDKLEAYKRLQIPEVWFWENGVLRLYSLGDNGYMEVDRSFVLPQLDIVLLALCINIENHLQAMREFRQAIQSS